MHIKIVLTNDSGEVYEGEVELKPANAPDRHRSNASTVKVGSRSNKEEIGENFKFPDWFYKADATTAHAVAILLYELNVALTSGQITKIISKVWKDIDLRNVSKVLTTRGKWLYVYVDKDSDGRYILNSNGRQWVEKEIIPSYKKVQ